MSVDNTLETLSALVPELLSKDLKILVSYNEDVNCIPPVLFSRDQVTFCPKLPNNYNSPRFIENRVKIHGLAPIGYYDIFNFTRELNLEKTFDLVIVFSSAIEWNKPYDTKKFGCPTVLISLDSHHLRRPISSLVSYALLEGFDYVVNSYNRHHMHWFAAAGIRNIAWLPLITMTTVTGEWTETRKPKVNFTGSTGTYHPVRTRIVNFLIQSPVKENFETGTGTRQECKQKFAESLISVNCSLNGDLNLRNLEIISAGGFLLTDKLSPQSGFDKILSPGLDMMYTHQKKSYSLRLSTT